MQKDLQEGNISPEELAEDWREAVAEGQSDVDETETGQNKVIPNGQGEAETETGKEPFPKKLSSPITPDEASQN